MKISYMNKTMLLAALCASAVQAATAQSGVFLDAAVGFSRDNSKIVLKDKSNKPAASNAAAADAISTNRTLTQEDIDAVIPPGPENAHLRAFLNANPDVEPNQAQKDVFVNLINTFYNLDTQRLNAVQPLTPEETTRMNQIQDFVRKMGRGNINKLMTGINDVTAYVGLAKINNNRILFSSQQHIDALFNYCAGNQNNTRNIQSIIKNSDLTNNNLYENAQRSIDNNPALSQEEKISLTNHLKENFDKQKDSKNPKKLKGESSSTATIADGVNVTIKNKSKGSFALRMGAGYRYVLSPQCANSFVASFTVDHTFIFGSKKVDVIWDINRKEFSGKIEANFYDKTFGRTAFVFSPGYRMCGFSIYADLGLSLNYVKISTSKEEIAHNIQNLQFRSQSKVIPAFLVGLGVSHQIAPKIELYANGRVHFLKKWKVDTILNTEIDVIRKGTAFEIMVGMRFAV